jgi:hypothetical protein
MTPSRFPIRNSRGSALILFLGVAAAVSIIAAGMVMLLLNTQHSTAMERQRTSAFDVAEAALDVGMQKLGSHWPTSSTNSTWFPAADFFDSNYEDLFPNATANPDTFVQVRLADNTDPSQPFDADEDGYVYLDAQARIGKRASRVHALIEVTYYDFNLLRGLALYTRGVPTNKGGDPKITVEVFPPGDTVCSWATPDVDPTSAQGKALATFGAPYMAWLNSTSATVPQRTDILSDETIAQVEALASDMGRFSDYGAGSVPGSYSVQDGLCVVKAASGVVSMNGNEVHNSEQQPGVLLILGGATLRMTGNSQFYGLIYCQGNVETDKSNGTPRIHGMLITDGKLTGSGTPDIRYNDRCIAGISHQFPVGTRLVPGYWRELKPTM